MNADRASLPLVTQADIERELARLFGEADGQLVVRVLDDGAGQGAANDTFHEMMASLRNFGSIDAPVLGDAMVEAPSRAQMARALCVLALPELQKRLLDQVLTTFGRRLIDPVGIHLSAEPGGGLLHRMQQLKVGVLQRVDGLQLTADTRVILRSDLEKLLTDDYLGMLAEHEEKVQRPKVERLAREVLRLIGGTFHAALQRWPGHADHIALAISRRVKGKVALREVPRLIRDQIVNGIEEFLWVETSADVDGALRSLFASHRDLVLDVPVLERDAYREFAEACWHLVSDHC